MAANNIAFEAFKKAHEYYFSNQGSNFTNESELSKEVNTLLTSAEQYETTDSYSSSCFYCLASYACIYFLYSYNVNSEYAKEKGRFSIRKATSLCKNDVYDFLDLLYRATNLPKNPYRALSELETIHKLCPSFKFLEDHLVNSKHLGEVYDSMMGYYLSLVSEELMDKKDYYAAEKACLFLQQFSGDERKLRAFDYLCIINAFFGKDDEALRYAKLGVELLGSDVTYDYKNTSHNFWADCWWHVAEINRRKKDYDFAMSIFEKGANLGIVECIKSLGAMYEKGESEDVDIEMAEKLYAQADCVIEERARVAAEEAERIHLQQEREAELARQKIAEAKYKTQLENELLSIKSKIYIYYIAIVILGLFLGWELYSTYRTLPIDVAGKYIEAGNRILLLNEKSTTPYFVYQNGSEIKLVKNGKHKKLMSFDGEGQIKELSLVPSESSGLMILASPINRSIGIWDSSQVLDISSGSTFLIMKKSVDTRKISSSNGTIDSCFLVSEKSSVPILLKKPSIRKHSNGNCSINCNLKGNLFDIYSNFFSSRYNTRFLKSYRKYVDFDVDATLQNNSIWSINNSISFPMLDREYYSRSVGTWDQLKEVKADLDDISSHRLTERQISKLFNTNRKLERHHGYSNQYTFVINYLDHPSDEEKVGLYKVDNYNRTYSKVTNALEVSFLSDRIRVKKYDTFLLFFDSSETIYYDYYGNRLR